MILDPILDLLRGKAVTIPPMDGALRPNTRLEDADMIFGCEAPDNLVVLANQVVFSSDKQLLALPARKSARPNVVAEFDCAITAAAAAETGVVAVGLDAGGIAIMSADGSRRMVDGFNCPVALAFGGGEDLYVCNGSSRHKPSGWVHDFMQKNVAGSVWHVKLSDGSRKCLADGLAFPYGIVVDRAKDRLIVSESWRHRLVAIPVGGGTPTPVLSKLPGYPARLSAMEGGYALSLFAPRNRLIEFVLLEEDYRRDMMREIDSRYWIAPSLSPNRSFLEPLQNGGVRTMGIHKPWSPTRSYGLVVELDGALQPCASYHSRANGARHGVTSAIEHDGNIIAVSKGGNSVLRLARSKRLV